MVFSYKNMLGQEKKIPLPKDSWVSLDERVIDKSFTCETYHHFSDAIEIFTVPDEIKNAFIATAIADVETKEKALKIANSESYKTVFNLFVDTVVKPRLLGEDVPEIDQIVFNSPGKKAVTRHHKVGLYAGLHYDNCDNNPSSLASISRNRLCFNIGREPRYFVFRNLFHEDYLDHCNKSHFSDEEYPLLKLKINPFEGYIAPVERILHEGYTYQMTSPDLSLAVRSYIGITTLPMTKKVMADLAPIV